MGLRQTIASLFSGRSRVAEQVLASVASNRVTMAEATLRLKGTFEDMLDRNERITYRPKDGAQEPRD
jgi:hypothetical protein